MKKYNELNFEFIDTLKVFASDGIHNVREGDYNKFVENSSVSYGEEGKHWKIFFVVDSMGRIMEPHIAEQYCKRSDLEVE